MDLIEILRKRVKPGDHMTDERRRMLQRALGSLEGTQVKNAFKIITGYKENYDKVKMVGESSSTIPYYGVSSNVDEDAGTMDVTFTISNTTGDVFPEELQLILEQLIESLNRR